MNIIIYRRNKVSLMETSRLVQLMFVTFIWAEHNVFVIYISLRLFNAPAENTQFTRTFIIQPQ